ncbi:hypothetical protein Cadr_000019001 [Camelus dromedarius]|uniref:Uncharacterized protein n=1 Tax=Camelus dromedarius TaxID=9838 RepID=A0A5N4D2N7_CAMDR|nr:hypothetical protein Cadr_000019001 [Camelus dromedarius]
MVPSTASDKCQLDELSLEMLVAFLPVLQRSEERIQQCSILSELYELIGFHLYEGFPSDLMLSLFLNKRLNFPQEIL